MAAGDRQAEHGVTLGFYQGELLRRIDPRHRSLGQFFEDEIEAPVDLHVDIHLPHTVADVELATISRPGFRKMMTGFPLAMAGRCLQAAFEHPPRSSTRGCSTGRPAVSLL